MDDKKITIEKYKKLNEIVRYVGIVPVLVALGYFITAVLNSQTFDITIIVACAVFFGSVIVSIGLFKIMDVKRSKIIKKYYGTVSDEDRKKAEDLLTKIEVIDKNEYDFYDILRCDNEYETIKYILKLIANGKKVYTGFYEVAKTIEREILRDNAGYDDIEYNNFIFELMPILENNLCDI